MSNHNGLPIIESVSAATSMVTAVCTGCTIDKILGLVGNVIKLVARQDRER